MEQDPIYPPSQPPPPPPPPRRSAARWIIPLAIVLLFVGVVVIGGLVLIGAAVSVEPIAHGTVLELNLAGPMRESPDPLGLMLPGLAGPPSLFEIRAALHNAASDDKITGLKIDVARAGFGWGAAQELRAAVDTFRSSGKPVHVFLRGDMVSDLDYAVALSGDTIWLSPAAGVFVNGLRAEVEFWRGTLDKLHIEPQYFMMREYKSAGEPMSRYEMSEHFREATFAVLDDIWGTFLGEVASRRGLTLDQVRRTADRGVMSPKTALAEKWIDRIGFDDEIESELVDNGQYSGLSVRKYLDRTRRSRKRSTGQTVALVFGEGPIVSSTQSDPFGSNFQGPRVARAIRSAADDASIAAILLRVDSPGGSAVGSDHVWRAIEYARSERGKPVIASMSTVAGSGGYWVAMGCDGIVARPSTITGSIGVVFGKLNVRGLYELIGANIDSIQVGENAGLLSAATSFDDAQRELIMAWMEDLYAEFKAKVAAGRDLDLDAVEELARGRIWSGVDALELGLIDRLGGYDEAIEIAKEKAGIATSDDIRLEIYPRPKSFIELLLSEDGMVQLGSRTRGAPSPEELVRHAFAEFTRPGAWAIMPSLHVE